MFASSIPRFKRGLKFRSLGTEVPDESADAAPEHVAAEPVTPESETQMADECEDSPLGHFSLDSMEPFTLEDTGPNASEIHWPSPSSNHFQSFPILPMASRQAIAMTT